MKPTGIVRDPIFLKHDMGRYHPESPERLEVIYSLLDKEGANLNLVEIPGRIAEKDEIALNHSASYIDRIEATSERSSTYLDPDTSCNSYTWEAAARAVGGLFNLVDAVVAGEVRNGFALVRPPGHHAEYDRAMGFCMFNNVALAAKYALKKDGLGRVAIVDWDLHHGNGTQHSFYDMSETLFISIHQFPHYPGTGAAGEIGRDRGKGYTVNVPMNPGAKDADYLMILHSVVAPVLEEYKPDIILVSAGFDAHYSDPLGGIGLTSDGYEQMLQILMHLAAEYSSDRLILTLEGGYNLDALRESIGKVLVNLGSFDPDKSSVPVRPSVDSLHPRAVFSVQEVVSALGEYWKGLAPIQ